MSLRTKLLIPILCLIVLVTGLTNLIFSINCTNLINTLQEHNQSLYDNTIKGFSKEKIRQIQNDINEVGERAVSISSLFSNWEPVTRAYEKALKGNIDDPYSPESQKAREDIRTELAPFLRGYKKTEDEDLKLHFHLPNGRSLTRLWRKGYQTTINGKKVDISDDLSSFRHTVLQINQKPYSPIRGIEVGRGGFVIRGLASVDSKTQHLGSVEVLFPFSELIKRNRSSENMYFAVYMDKSLLPIAKGLQDKNKYPILDNRYVLTDATDKSVTDPLVTSDFLTQGRSKILSQKTEDFMNSVFPILDYSGKTIGVIFFALDITSQDNALIETTNLMARDLNKLKWGTMIGIISLMVILFILLFIIATLIFKPLQILNRELKNLSEQDADLKVQVKLNTKDEIGQVALSFNAFIEKLRQMMNQVKKAINETDTIQDQIAQSSQESKESGIEIDKRLESIDGSINFLDGEIEKSQTTIKNVANSIKEVDSQIINQASMVEESTAAVTQMIASLESVNQVVQHKKETTKALSFVADQGKEQIQATSQNFKKVVEFTTLIQEMANSISGIASQTNLLSMNAAIEAAHAGESGKGFAVVAEEIRKLADSSAQSSKQISQLIENISLAVQETDEQVSKTDSIFLQISKDITETIDAFNEIDGSVSELNVGGKQILESISEINIITQNIREGSQNINEGATHLLDGSSRIKESSFKVVMDINSSKEKTEAIVLSVETMVKLSEKLSTLSKDLKLTFGNLKT